MYAPSPTVAAINAAVNAANANANTSSSSSTTPATAPTTVMKSIEEYNQQNPNAPTAVRSLEKTLASKPQPVPMKGKENHALTILIIIIIIIIINIIILYHPLLMSRRKGTVPA